MKASMGHAGWVELAGDFGLPGRVYVRLTRVGARFRVSEMYLDGQGEPIQPGALRQFPLGTAEDWLAPEEKWLETGEGLPGPDLSRLASYFGGTHGTYKGQTCASCGAPLDRRRKAITDWVVLSWLAQYGTIPQPKPRPSSVEGDAPAPAISLSDPIGGLTDSFLDDVAHAYRAAVGQGRTDPAVAIADLPTVNATVRTVHSWIYKARNRGFLPRARRDGKV